MGKNGDFKNSDMREIDDDSFIYLYRLIRNNPLKK